jgi:flagellar assembly factor FliW
MNSVNPSATDTLEAPEVRHVKLPMGLLGFEDAKEYLLIGNPGEEPFFWLRVHNNSGLAFVVIDPFLVVPDYHPDIPQPDVDFLGIASPEDAQLYSIVTLHGATNATLNLKGPLVFNRQTLTGKQVIITNAADYSVQHALPLGEQPS